MFSLGAVLIVVTFGHLLAEPQYEFHSHVIPPTALPPAALAVTDAAGVKLDVRVPRQLQAYSATTKLAVYQPEPGRDRGSSGMPAFNKPRAVVAARLSDSLTGPEPIELGGSDCPMRITRLEPQSQQFTQL